MFFYFSRSFCFFLVEFNAGGPFFLQDTSSYHCFPYFMVMFLSPNVVLFSPGSG